MNGYFCQGFNPLLSFPNREKITAALSKLKFLVVMDPLETETARFWENHGELQRRRSPRTSRPRCSSCRSTCFAEDDGSLVNSGRWLQWHWAGGTPPGEAKRDIWIMAQLYLRLKALYQKEGGAFPDPILNLHWPYKDPDEPHAGGTRQGDQRLRRSTTLTDPTDPDQGAAREGQAARRLRRAARRRHDRVRLLDLLRLLHRGGQQHGPPGQHRSRRHRRLPRSGRSPGRPTAASSTTAPRADLDGKPWDPKPQADRVGRREVGGLRRARHRARPPSPTW